MDLTAAIAELRARGVSYETSAGGRPTIWLNDAKNELDDFYPWPWLETTTTGTSPLTISDLKYVQYVVDTTDQVELWGINAADIVSQSYYDLSMTGTPEVWYLDGTTTLKIWPTSTASLSVRYVKVSPELSSGTDTPLFPSRYSGIWIDLAMVRAYLDSDDLDRAFALRKDCQARLGQLVEEFEARNRQNQVQQQINSGAADW